MEKDSGGQFIDIFANVVKNPSRAMCTQIKWGVAVELNKKKNESSTKLREFGNTKVNEQDWHSAMASYNRSLRYAEHSTENFSLAYANRSLCFLKMNMYDKCLVDIKMAIEANCPQHLMAKLEQRRTHCSKHMNTVKSTEPAEPTLDFDEDKHFPGMANVLQMQFNEKFGRHFIAKCDIDIGKVVVVDEAFVTSPVIVCDTCFKNMTNFSACPHWTTALFCSQTCAKDLLHRMRCKRSSAEDSLLEEFALRSIMKAFIIFETIENWMDFVKSVVDETQKVEDVPHSIADMKSQYRMFLKLNLWLTAEDQKQIIDRGDEVFEIDAIKT